MAFLSWLWGRSEYLLQVWPVEVHLLQAGLVLSHFTLQILITLYQHSCINLIFLMMMNLQVMQLVLTLELQFLLCLTAWVCLLAILDESIHFYLSEHMQDTYVGESVITWLKPRYEVPYSQGAKMHQTIISCEWPAVHLMVWCTWISSPKWEFPLG